MKWASILGITAVVALIILCDWPKFNINQKIEKVTFIILLGLGSVIAMLLIFFPDMPGPTQMIDAFFKPLDKIFE
jgi:hypothetical protein